MNTSKSKIVYFIVALFAINGSSARAYTVADAISRAKVENEALQIEQKDADMKKLEKSKVFSEFLPRIIAQSSITKYDQSIPRNSNIKKQSKNQLSVEQELFAFGSSAARFSAASQRAKAADLTYKNEINKLILNVIESYVDVLSARSRLYIALQREESAGKIAKLTQIRCDNGAVPVTDVYMAKSSAEMSLAQKESSIADLRSMEEKYSYIVGEFPPIEMMHIDAYAVELPQNIESLIKVANMRNPSFSASKYAFFAAKADKIGAVADLMPRVSVQASASYYPSTTPSAGSFYKGHDGSLSLQISVPLFNKGLEYLAIRERGYAVERNKANYTNVAEGIAASAAQYWANYQAAKETIISNKKAIASTQMAFNGIKEQYEHGTRTITDLLEAQKTLFDLKERLIGSAKSFVMAAFSIKALCDEVDHYDYNKISYQEGKITKVENLAIAKYSAKHGFAPLAKSEIDKEYGVVKRITFSVKKQSSIKAARPAEAAMQTKQKSPEVSVLKEKYATKSDHQ